MLNDIIPLKIIIEFDPNGDFRDGIILYKKKMESGSIEKKTYSLSIQKGINIPQMHGILQSAILFAKKQEGLNG